MSILGERYICNKCGEEFEHPKVLFGYNPDYPRDGDCPNEYVCPYCESDDYDLAYNCESCGDLHRDHELMYGVCRDCLALEADHHAADYVMNDPEVRDSFAWYMHLRRHKNG